MMNTIRLLVFFVVALITLPLLAVECDLASRPDYSSRFDVNDDGTVTDIESGLTWMRCALGQRWDGKGCIGEARKLSWGQANSNSRISINNVSNKQFQNRWRLPKLNELATIVDLRCYSPRIDQSIFPNTVASPYWTMNTVAGEPGQAYTLGFGRQEGDKGVARHDKAEQHFVRFVRGRE